MPKKLTIKEFIARSAVIHKDKYNYEKVVYVNSHTKVEIFCLRCHASFYQKPYLHLLGKGCRTCSYDLRGGKRRHSTEEFVEKANLKYNNFFNYSKVVYKGSKTKVIIVCPLHGVFKQRPNDHLNVTHGCPKCGYFSNSGENNCNWAGGDKEYCNVWQDRQFKSDIRSRDHNICQNPYCFKTTTKLSIHHINYDKMDCHPKNLITVCVGCNSRANKDRNWHFEWYSSIIDKKYNA